MPALHHETQSGLWLQGPELGMSRKSATVQGLNLHPQPHVAFCPPPWAPSIPSGPTPPPHNHGFCPDTGSIVMPHETKGAGKLSRENSS